MGTDLHLLPEVKHRDDEWHPIGTMTTMDLKRDYPAFALLSDVRNQSGRHRPVWQEPRTIRRQGRDIDIPGWWYNPDDGGHDRLNPISEPRGVPDDASPEWRRYVQGWLNGGGIVETSWVLPEEILDADWDQVIYGEGVLAEQEYLDLRDNGTVPTTPAMDAGGEGVRTVTEIEYAAGVRGEEVTVVKARWKEGTLLSHSGYFREIAETIVKMSPPSSKVRFMLLFES